MRSRFVRIATILGFVLVLVVNPSALVKEADGAVSLSSQEVIAYSISDGLVVYYPFNGNADDASGNGNHGLVHGAILANDRFGNSSNAYSFDGVDDYIMTNSNISLGLDYSVVLWFNYTGPTHGTLFHRGYTGWCWYEPHIQITESLEVIAAVSGCNSAGLVGASAIISGEWYQVAIVARDGSQEFYVNGVQMASTSHTDRWTFSYQAFVGTGANQNTPVGTYYHGLIDDVRIYNRALSEAEIQLLYGRIYLPLVMHN